MGKSEDVYGMYTSNSTLIIALAILQQIVTLLPGKGSHTSASLSYSGSAPYLTSAPSILISDVGLPMVE